MTDFDKQITAGLAALESLKRTTVINFGRWLVIGQGLEAGKAKLREALRLNNFESELGKKALGQWFKQSGYDVVPAPTRTYLARIVEHRAEVTAWYQGLSEGKKLRFNSPGTIWAKFESQNRSPRASREALELSDRVAAVAAVILKISKDHDQTVTDIIGLLRAEITRRRTVPTIEPIIPRRRVA